jgi:hypothetical protein
LSSGDIEEYFESPETGPPRLDPEWRGVVSFRKALGRFCMRVHLVLCVLALTAFAAAKDPKIYQTGTLVQMSSAACGVENRDHAAAAAQPGDQSGVKESRVPLCQEYLLQVENVIYRIRPSKQKHSTLLPVGDRAQFRLAKDKMLLRLEDDGGKEREYIVLSVSPRSDSDSAEVNTPRINRLQ